MTDVVVQTSEGTLLFWCPGCRELHAVWLAPMPNPTTGAVWTWNGSTDRPTFSPSILVHGFTNGRIFQPRCHSYVRDGVIEFLGDCEHDLAGRSERLLSDPLSR